MRIPSSGKQFNAIDPNLELVVSMGGDRHKGYDPIPPDNYLCFMTDKDPVQRVLAWVRAYTIRYGYRSPFAANSQGIPKTKRDLARDCFESDLPAAWKAWSHAVERGLVFADSEGRLCLAGKVRKLPFSKRGEESSQKSLETICPRYVVERLRLLEDRGRGAEILLLANEEYFSKATADIVTLLEIQRDAIKNQVLTHHLGEGNGLRKLKKKKRPDLHERGQSELISFELHHKPEQLESFLRTTDDVSGNHEKGVSANQAGSSAETRGGVRCQADLQAFQQLANDVPLSASQEKPSSAQPVSDASVNFVDEAPWRSVDPFVSPNPPGGRAPAVEPPARPPEWHSELRKIMHELPIGTVLDEPMFLRIASHLDERLLKQFKDETRKAKNIRKWAGYESIAKQIAARGPINEAVAAGDADLEDAVTVLSRLREGAKEYGR